MMLHQLPPLLGLGKWGCAAGAPSAWFFQSPGVLGLGGGKVLTPRSCTAAGKSSKLPSAPGPCAS